MMTGYVQDYNPFPALPQKLAPLKLPSYQDPTLFFSHRVFYCFWIIYAPKADLFGSGTQFFSLQDVLPCCSVFQLSGLIRYPAEVCGRGCKGEYPAVLRGRPWAPFQASFLPLSTAFCSSQWLPCCYVISLSFCFPSPGLASQPCAAGGAAPTGFLWLYLSLVYLLWKWRAQTFLCVTSSQNLRTWTTGWEPFTHWSINYLTRTERC